jgi:adenylate kinase
VVDFIQGKMMPIIKRYAVSGRAMINSEECLFEDPVAIAILIDVFSERGFRASVDIHHQEIPERFDLTTGEIKVRTKRVYRMTILFNGSKIRRG